LRRSPAIDIRHLMHARDGAMWGATFFREELAPDVGNGILLQRDGGIAALLRTVVHQPVLANVEVPRSRAAAPLVRLAVGDVVLEPV